MTANEIITYYERLFRFPYLLTIEDRADRSELESIKDTIWYTSGLYDALGYDRHGRTYVTVEDDSDYWQAVDQRAYNREQDAVYDGRTAK